jgi:hypothetical protein
VAWTEYTDCPNCDKPVAVYNPRHGDGSIRITHWHKRREEDGETVWCRAEVDYGGPGFHDLRRSRHPLPTA